MKKTEEMRSEYRREDLGKGVRGKHYAALKKGSKAPGSSGSALKRGAS